MRPLFRCSSIVVSSRAPLFVLACLATLVVAFYLFEQLARQTRLESYRSTAEQSGLKL
jgi:hypothetical protein